MVEAVKDSGEHIESNHTGTRQTGSVSPSLITFPAGSSGAATVVYTSTEVSGVEKIIAEVVDDKESKCESPVRVRVPGLFDLGLGGSYRLTGNTGRAAIHPNNHYGTGSTVVRTHYMANDFYEQFNATLGINNMSLSGGGLFDIDGDWDTPHDWHRKGTSVDIDRCAMPTNKNNPNPRGDCPNGWIQVNRANIEEICKYYGGYLENEPTIHCEFSRGGSLLNLLIPILPIEDGGDIGGGTADGGQIPQ